MQHNIGIYVLYFAMLLIMTLFNVVYINTSYYRYSCITNTTDYEKEDEDTRKILLFYMCFIMMFIIGGGIMIGRHFDYIRANFKDVITNRVCLANILKMIATFMFIALYKCDMMSQTGHTIVLIFFFLIVALQCVSELAIVSLIQGSKKIKMNYTQQLNAIQPVNNDDIEIDEIGEIAQDNDNKEGVNDKEETNDKEEANDNDGKLYV